MGKILASENQEWWSRLNTEYIRFAGKQVASKAVSEGDKVTSAQMNDFLDALSELKNKNYSKLIDWSEYDSLSIQSGDLINIIAINNIDTTLDRLSNQCVYDSNTGKSTTSKSTTSNSTTSNSTNNRNSTKWGQETSYAKSNHSTESNAPAGHSNVANTKLNRCTDCIDNINRRK